ncbi:unnamed protein product [marine sediment metagenome]|uniref:Uncharacterized protein n=1 Tax=marine sediment metagenome TaxID=412755 RepID=X0TID0_9ZZZZ
MKRFDPDSAYFKVGSTITYPTVGPDGYGEEIVSVRVANALVRIGYEKGWYDGIDAEPVSLL